MHCIIPNESYNINYNVTILDVRKIGHLNIKTKMLDIEARVLIGCYSLASQSERVPTRCFYVKMAYLFYRHCSFEYALHIHDVIYEAAF